MVIELEGENSFKIKNYQYIEKRALHSLDKIINIKNIVREDGILVIK
jgi:hypothetical protein